MLPSRNVPRRVKRAPIEQQWVSACGFGSGVPVFILYERKKKKPKTAYQHFFAIRREELSATNSQLSFGELSKQVSQQWKTMSVEEKNKYGTTPTCLPEVDKPVTFDNILQFAEDDYVDDRTTFETNDSDNDDGNIDEEDEFMFEGDDEEC